jgi:snRNA-activating protein complex subunit 3
MKKDCLIDRPQRPKESSRANSIINDDDEAIIVITTFDKVPWSPCYVTRLSQHAFLSSQTLEDLCKAIPCAPYAAQVPSSLDSLIHGYAVEEGPGRVVCIEGMAYGDEGEGDYAA